MRIALVSDAWAPQVNGVVRTLEMTVQTLRRRGHIVETITPDAYRTVACPSYPEIRLALAGRRAIGRRLDGFAPDALHIATEGPLGWAARGWALAEDMPFTTSFHTRFPDYVAMRTRLPADWFWPVVRRFHGPAVAAMVATPTLAAELAENGIGPTMPWSRGVDLSLFTPDGPSRGTATQTIERSSISGSADSNLSRPILLYVGRVAVEKSIDVFLAADVPGTKVVVGDGPARAMLATRFPDAVFLGPLRGEALAAAYRSADAFVFPSRTDTFGLVMIEALACGTPVAAFPVAGPLDIVGRDGHGPLGRSSAPIGVLDEDLAVAIRRALLLDRAACAAEGRRYSWDACTDQFQAALRPRSRATYARAA